MNDGDYVYSNERKRIFYKGSTEVTSSQNVL